MCGEVRRWAADRTATNNNTIHTTAKLLPRIYRSKMSQTTKNNRNTQMLSRICRYKMSNNNTNSNDRTTQMLPRVYRSQMS
jgi:hypothetical protein